MVAKLLGRAKLFRAPNSPGFGLGNLGALALGTLGWQLKTGARLWKTNRQP